MSIAAFFHSLFKKSRKTEMSTLEAGVKAPEIHLPTMSGDEFTLSKALQKGPVLLVFFKISCPVCQFAMPYAERLFQTAKGKNATVIGVSQDNRGATTKFMKQYHLTLPIALDDTHSYLASNAYGLTTVPNFFLVGTSGKIEIASTGWSREEVERMYHSIMAEPKPAALFRPDERIPELKFG
jgi:peroxiredoxin